ncbi:rhodanese-like domain-containing protein [Candidatus Rariloculus sp.]|uniref:rhodanese-like domain-containing protein n=1 Tax=Candidatus Rariloculus sp. TaxID=3101265 RepID=UPI003D0E8EAD
MSAVPELTPTEFRERWPDADAARAPILLDVREPEELAIAAVSDVVHIPMGQIPARLAELDRDKPIVCMCHGGVRSLRVAEFLSAHGFEHVFNLSGGIDAWSQQIDPDIPRY